MMPRFLAGAVLLFASLAAFAGQVGQLTATTHLGQPLSARIELYGFSAAAIDGAELTLAADLTAGAAERAAVAGLAAAPARYGDGTPYIRLTSSAPIAEPIVRFRLRMTVAGRTRIARHTLALTPAPAPAQAPPAVQRPATSAQPSPVITTTTTYGPVRPGQTLWRILRELGLTGNGQQALIERIVSASPDAFVNGNADRLRVGAMLTIPATAASVASAPDAVETTIIETPATAPHTDAPVDAPAVQDTPTLTTSVSATDTAQATTAPRTATAATSAVDVAARQARIEALTRKFAAIRARYERQQSVAAATQQQQLAPPAAATPSSAADETTEARASTTATAPVRPPKTAAPKPQAATTAGSRGTIPGHEHPAVGRRHHQPHRAARWTRLRLSPLATASRTAARPGRR